MKPFKISGASYRYVQDVNGGQQWRCDYDDGEFALAMVYKLKPTRKDIVDAFDDINGLKDEQ